MNNDAIQTICVLRLSAIGDVCNAVAAVQAIQKRHSEAKITWIIGTIEHQLLQGLPGIEFIVFDKKQGKQAFREFKAKMKSRRFDVLLHMQVALRASLISRHIKATRKIGFDRARSKELQSFFINERINARAQSHVLEGFFDFAEAIGVTKDAYQHPQWDIPQSADDASFAAQVLAEGKPNLVIVPAASNPERNWSPESYAEICNYAHDLGFSTALCGGPSAMEASLAQSISSQSAAPLKNLVGQTQLKQLLAILNKADLVIAPDTGPAHMAVSQGTPVIGLYGHSNPKRTGPYLFQDYVVEVYYRFLQEQTGKTVERLPWGQRVKGTHVMKAIPVEDVTLMIDRVCEEHQLLASKSAR